MEEVAVLVDSLRAIDQQVERPTVIATENFVKI